MKKFIGLFLVGCLALVGCSQKEGVQGDTIKVSMVSDVAGVEDGSFSQLTWEGLKSFGETHENVEVSYVTPKDTNTTELVSNIDNLVMKGNQVIVVAGFAFQEAIEQASANYPDVDFVLIDGVVEADNVVSVSFAENESGFLAGVASALESKSKKVGYLGGIDVPAVVNYGEGFVQGVEYANEHFGIDVVVSDYVYSGTFTDFNVGQTLSGGMYDKGVDIIMATAGVATQGAISEAKQRGGVYVVGCDSDQYADGLDDNGSVVLTSGMKYIDVAVIDILTKWINNEFPSGEIIEMNAQSNGVGLPSENPNLQNSTIEKLKEVEQLLKEGKIQLSK